MATWKILLQAAASGLDAQAPPQSLSQGRGKQSCQPRLLLQHFIEPSRTSGVVLSPESLQDIGCVY